MVKVIGYTYEADEHCVNCTKNRFGDDAVALHPKQECKDNDGNPIHPIFDIDEHPNTGIHCGDCGDEIYPAGECSVNYNHQFVPTDPDDDACETFQCKHCGEPET
jgi:hypothetical protein